MMFRPIQAFLCRRTIVLGAALKETHCTTTTTTTTTTAAADTSHLVSVQFLFIFIVVTHHKVANLIQQTV